MRTRRSRDRARDPCGIAQVGGRRERTIAAELVAQVRGNAQVLFVAVDAAEAAHLFGLCGEAPAPRSEWRVESERERVRARAVTVLGARATAQAHRARFENVAELHAELVAVGSAFEQQFGCGGLELRVVADAVAAGQDPVVEQRRAAGRASATEAAREITLERKLAAFDAEAERRLACVLGVLVEREGEARDRCFAGLLARACGVHAPEPVEIGLDAARACAVPPELADHRARVVAGEHAEQLAFGFTLGIDAERDAAVAADVGQRDRGIGHGRSVRRIVRPGLRVQRDGEWNGDDEQQQA